MRTISISVVIITLLAAVSASGQSAQAPVTFTKDVAPIFQARCQICHHPGTFAPMSLTTYEDARPWARSIKEKVLMREMPPWHLDKNVGVQYFSNDISLTDEQIATIVKWVDAGAVKGNPADMPPARKFDDNETWQIGEPDRVITLPKDVIVKAKAPDQWPDILVDPGLTEDRYIKGVQIIPVKGFPVIHHIRTSIVEPTNETRNSGKLDDTDGSLEVGEQGVFLNEYAIGKKGDVFPDGSGRLIKAGTKINFQLHLHSTGTETPTNVALGLKFYPKGYTPNHVISSTTVSVNEIDLRPNTSNIRSDGYLTLAKPARLLSFQPHMHNRGKAKLAAADHEHIARLVIRVSVFASSLSLCVVVISNMDGAQIKYARGQDVSPTFDGWQQNKDGSYTLYFGYFNRNFEEEVDIPIGHDNNFDLNGKINQAQAKHF